MGKLAQCLMAEFKRMIAKNPIVTDEVTAHRFRLMVNRMNYERFNDNHYRQKSKSKTRQR